MASLEDSHGGEEAIQSPRTAGPGDTVSSPGGSKRSSRSMSRASSSTPVPPPTSGTMWRLYTSHTLSAWSDRMLEFAVTFFMIAIWPNSLTLVATRGLVIFLGQFLFGPHVGHYVDTTPRLRAVKVCLVVQNAAVICAATIVGGLVYGGDGLHSGTFWFLVVLALLSDVVSTLASLGSTITVEKDWVPTLCKSDSELLSHTNAVMRRIDLACKLLAPVAIGLVLTYAGVFAGTVAVAIWNAVSGIPEYLLLVHVYNTNEVLQLDKKNEEKEEDSTWSEFISTTFSKLLDLKRGWKTYQTQPISVGALAFSLIYCTVLSFGGVMQAYCYYKGVTEAVLSGLRGIGAVFGIMATLTFPLLRRRIGVVRFGLVSVWAQLGLLAFTLAALLVGDPSEADCKGDDVSSGCEDRRLTELALLMTGVVVSRYALWSYDLAVNQMLQQFVVETERGSVNGVQAALQSVFDLFGFIFSLVFNDPDQFASLVIISYAFVAVSALGYTWFVFRSGPSLEARSGTSSEYVALSQIDDSDSDHSDEEMETLDAEASSDEPKTPE